MAGRSGEAVGLTERGRQKLGIRKERKPPKARLSRRFLNVRIWFNSQQTPGNDIKNFDDIHLPYERATGQAVTATSRV